MDLMKLMKDAQQMQERLQKAQEELARITVAGSAGGGMVVAEADGRGIVTKVRIDPSVVNPADVEMLEDLVTVAVNEAQKKAQQTAAQEMSKVTGGMNLPFGLPG
ncbi:MAG: YbaB/EbfC family nucleoid-associated protein [Gemmatimonadaceae bacterium]|jgi:DNA-binding YbaB/EbfC family protein|nr:YbaB/EbfC family nucleoid-associated protein [Gemmatimonadaceae bacterium]